MKTHLKDCSPSVCNGTDLMTNEWEFMNKENIKERCIDCTKQEVCIRIVDLLTSHKVDAAIELVKYTDAGLNE